MLCLSVKRPSYDGRVADVTLTSPLLNLTPPCSAPPLSSLWIAESISAVLDRELDWHASAELVSKA